MSIQRWIFGIVALFVMTASMTLPPEATAGDLLLEILLEKGIITKDELIRLKAEEKKREAAQAAEQAKKKPEVKVDVVKEKQQPVKAAKQDKEEIRGQSGLWKKGVYPGHRGRVIHNQDPVAVSRPVHLSRTGRPTEEKRFQR